MNLRCYKMNLRCYKRIKVGDQVEVGWDHVSQYITTAEFITTKVFRVVRIGVVHPLIYRNERWKEFPVHPREIKKIIKGTK